MSKHSDDSTIPHRHERSISDSEFNSVDHYNEAIALDPNNPSLYCNRSSAYLSAGKPQEAIRDARTAVSLQPDHSLPFYRLGLALKNNKSDLEAIVALCQSLARDPTDRSCASELTEIVLSGRFGEFTVTYNRLRSLGFENDVFILISSIGNELVKLDEVRKAVVVLQTARYIPTDKMKVKSTLLVSLAELYWRLKELGNAIEVLEENLEVIHDLVSQLLCVC